MLGGRRRIVVLAALALAVPLPALALSGDQPAQTTPAPVALNVSTTLGGCGAGQVEIICTLDVSFDTLALATSYTAAVTRADGSVVDYGAIAPGGASLSVPYVGPGTYSVRISAYGEETPQGGEEPAGDGGDGGGGEGLITSEANQTRPGSGSNIGEAEAETATEPGAASTGEPTPAGTGEAPTGETVAPCVPGPPTPAPDPAELPPLPEPPPEDLDPQDPDEDADGIPDADEAEAYQKALIERWAAEVAAQAMQPQAIECPPPAG